MLLFAQNQVLVGRTLNLNGVCEDLLELVRRTLGATVSVRTAFANNAPDALSAQPDAQVLLHTDHFDVEKSDLKSLVDLSEGHYVILSLHSSQHTNDYQGCHMNGIRLSHLAVKIDASYSESGYRT
ncbi:hypothetical protein [Paraburkholderia sediminicola]|uniref:hypothetical protein n=1 Tax=Paraburkholderia sediminicola TaxID=458836 RepID=UPI0038B960BA